MRRYTLVVALLAVFISVAAQPVISFKETVFDFGTFPEADGYVTHSFRFTNTGDASLVILNAKVTCGCTTPEYTREPIAPGKSGEIKVTYSASGRPGKFSKYVIITTNSVSPETILTIKGDVKGTDKPAEDSYTYNVNGLKLKTLHIPIGDIYNGETKSYDVEIKNDSRETLTVKAGKLPEYISVTVTPSVLQPKENGKITVTYNTGKLKDWGYQNEEFLINIDNGNGKPAAKKMTLFANVQEDFRTVPFDKLAKSPKISLSSPSLHFGEISDVQNTDKSVEINNTGKSTLLIRKISSVSQVITAKADRESVKSNGKCKLTVTVNPEKSRSKILNERITIITNDPENPVTYLQVTASFR